MNKSRISFIICISFFGVAFSLMVIDIINYTYIYKWESLSLIIIGILIIPFIMIFNPKLNKEKMGINND